MITLYIDGQLRGQHVYFDIPCSSVFTTLRSKNSVLLSWSLHWRRLSFHAQFFEYSFPKEQEIYRFIMDQLFKNDSDQKIRIIISERNIAVTFEPYLPPPSIIYGGVSTIISTIEVHPHLASFKTGNLLPYILARKEAEQHGVFEGFLLNRNGFVVDGSRTSIMHFNGEVLTALEGGLAGCMREQALDYAKMRGFKITRTYLTPEGLLGQVLLANSLLGIIPVESIKFDFVAELIDQFRMDNTNPRN
jgi:4-amino-4-deoxychorismate lyase